MGLSGGSPGTSCFWAETFGCIADLFLHESLGLPLKALFLRFPQDRQAILGPRGGARWVHPCIEMG